MRELREPDPALLVCSLLSARMDEHYGPVRHALTSRFGPLAFEGQPVPFEATDYYDREMGTPILRRLLGFDQLVPLDILPEAKRFCMDLEREHMEHGRRMVNLDPGLVSPERFLLATSKNFTHRVYLGQGVWADLTMIWTRGDWQTLPWTYLDYASPPLRPQLTALRRICLDKLGKLRQPRGGTDNHEGGTCP